MKPPPPMLPAWGCVTASANPIATAASTALPPALRISTPTCVASFSWLATIPFLVTTGRKRAVPVRIGAGAGGAVCAAHSVASTIANAARPALGKNRIASGRLSPLPVINRVRAHVGRARDAVRHVEEARDRRDVPDVPIGEADAAQALAVFLLDRPRLVGDLHGEIEHGALLPGELGGAIVHHHHFAQRRIARIDPHRGAVRGEAVVTAVL